LHIKKAVKKKTQKFYQRRATPIRYGKWLFASRSGLWRKSKKDFFLNVAVSHQPSSKKKDCLLGKLEGVSLSSEETYCKKV